MENKKQSAAFAEAFKSKNMLLGDQYFTDQLSPNSSLFDFSEITRTNNDETMLTHGAEQSFVSIHSLSERLWLKSVLTEWRKYHKQVRRDKQLFFAVRDFVIRRLTKKAFRAVKINFCQ